MYPMGLTYHHTFFDTWYHSCFPSTEHLCKIRTGSPPTGTLHAGGIYKFYDFVSNRPRSSVSFALKLPSRRNGRGAAAARPPPPVSRVCFLPRGTLLPWKFTVVTSYALLTRDLLTIARFLVVYCTLPSAQHLMAWVSRKNSCIDHVGAQ